MSYDINIYDKGKQSHTVLQSSPSLDIIRLFIAAEIPRVGEKQGLRCITDTSKGKSTLYLNVMLPALLRRALDAPGQLANDLPILTFSKLFKSPNYNRVPH